MIAKENYKERIIDPCIRMYENILWEKGVTEDELKINVEKEREWLGKEEVFAIPRISIIVTTRCSLNCVGCSQLIPCYKEPYDINLEDIIRCMDLILKAVDRCYSVDILGGEPFLVKEINKLLGWLKQQKKILQISFTTNGTVVLDKEIIKCLCDEKVMVRISDYGLIKQQSRFLSVLEDGGVHVVFESGMKWVDAGNGSPRNRSPEELKRLYRKCNSGKACKTLLNGKIYHCSRCANLYDLRKAFLEKSRDVFEIEGNGDVYTIRERLKRFFLIDYSNACDNCDLAIDEKNYIVAGMQNNEEIKNSNFTIISRRDFAVKDKMIADCRDEIKSLQNAIDDLIKMNDELKIWSEDLQKELRRKKYRK